MALRRYMTLMAVLSIYIHVLINILVVTITYRHMTIHMRRRSH